MTEKEIEEHLKALPYDVPADIRPGHISATMAAMGVEGKEAEEIFWNNLHQLSPKEQGEFFATARSNLSASKSLAWGVFAIIFLGLLWWLLS